MSGHSSDPSVEADQQINWPMEMERRNRELAVMTEERDTMLEAYASCSRAIGRRGTEEESLADQITALVAGRDEWKRAAVVEAEERRKLIGELDDMQRTFDLQWEADMRAVKRWREAHPGNELVLPDRANMVVWLMEEHSKLLSPTEAMLGAMALVLVDWLGNAPAHAMLEEAYRAAVAKRAS